MSKITGITKTAIDAGQLADLSSAPVSTKEKSTVSEAERIRDEIAMGHERAVRHSDHARSNAAQIAKAPIGKLSQERLGAIVSDMAELVRETTGLSLDTGRLDFSIVAGDQALQLVKADSKARLGASDDDDAKGMFGRLAKFVGEGVVKGAVQGAYLPSAQRFICVAGNVEKKGLDALRSTIYHELLHAAQHQTHPKYFDAVGDAYHAMKSAEADHGKSSSEYLDARDTFNARMTFLEGHPTYMQASLGAKEFPWANQSSAGEIGASLLFMLSRDGREKIGQYVRGKQTFEKMLAAPDGETLVAQAYANPQLVDILFKTRGKAYLDVKAGVDDAAAARLAATLVRFSSGTATNLELEIRHPGDGTA